MRRGLFQGAKEAVANVLSAGLLRRYGAWMDTDNARRESKAIYDRRPSGGGLSESSDELYQLDDLGHRVRKGSNFSADSLNSPLPFEVGSPAGHAGHARSFSLSGPSSGGNKPDKQDRRRSESSVVSGSSSNSNDNALRIVLTKPRRFSHQTSTTVWKSNLQHDFNVCVIERIAPYSSAVLRELDESNRFVQKSAESTSI